MADVETVDSLIQKFSDKYKGQLIVVGAEDPARIPTGYFPLDLAMGGGFPRSRVSVLFGMEGSCKTTIAFKTIASAQKLFPDRKAVFVDLEGRYSQTWARRMGVDVDSVVVIYPPTAEDGVDVIESLLYAEDLSIIAVDSLAAFLTDSELKSDASKAQPGTQGILINKLFRKVTRGVAVARQEKRDISLLLLNQIRDKIGVMYGSPQVQPGGNAFKFCSSMTVRVYGKNVKEKDSDLRSSYKHVTATIPKFQVPIVGEKAEFDVMLVPDNKYGLAVGDCYGMPTLIAYMKEFALLEQRGKPWVLVDPGTGEETDYKTRGEALEFMSADWELQRRIEDEVIRLALGG